MPFRMVICRFEFNILMPETNHTPESQTRPGFLGRNSYLLADLSIAIFYSNVRGPSG